MTQNPNSTPPPASERPNPMIDWSALPVGLSDTLLGTEVSISDLADETLAANPDLDLDDYYKIKTAPSMAEAIRIIGTLNVDMEDNAYYLAAVTQEVVDKPTTGGALRIPEGMGPSGRLDTLETIGGAPPREAVNPEVVALWDEIDAANEVIRELTDLLETEQAIEDPSLLLGPSTLGQGIPDTYWADRMASDYSPWGPARSRADMTYTMTKVTPTHEPLPPEDIRNIQEQYMSRGGYTAGSEIMEWAGMSPERRIEIEAKMVRAGLLDEVDGVTNYTPGAVGFQQMQALRTAMGMATVAGMGWEPALDILGNEHQRQLAYEQALADSQRSGVSRPTFSVPPNLRTIPDYKSIQQEVHNLFRQRLGRDAEEWELGVLADNMKKQYQNANSQMIKAARAAFWQAQGGGSGVMEVEVPDPQYRAQNFIEDRYGAEIGRHEQIEDTAVTNRLMVDAITRGTSMIGG